MWNYKCMYHSNKCRIFRIYCTYHLYVNFFNRSCFYFIIVTSHWFLTPVRIWEIVHFSLCPICDFCLPPRLQASEHIHSPQILGNLQGTEVLLPKAHNLVLILMSYCTESSGSSSDPDCVWGRVFMGAAGRWRKK